MLRDLDSDAICCTPSYCLYLAEAAEEQGLDLTELPVSRAVIGAEPFTDPMRAEIERELGVKAIDIYGLSELVGPGVSVECDEVQSGLHVWEDHFYPEVVDPETGEVLPEGEEGELVLTNLTSEALPAIRYRTGDITSLTFEACECGRTHARMDNVTGRVDDLLIVRGVNVYASQIEAVVVDLDDMSGHYRIDLYREDTLDTIEITAERREEAGPTNEELEAEIEARLERLLDITPDAVEVVDPGTVERTEVGKVKRVYDHRERARSEPDSSSRPVGQPAVRQGRYTRPRNVATRSSSSSVTTISYSAVRSDRCVSAAVAVSVVPVSTASRYEMFVSSANAVSPWEFDAAANAASASE
jgi:phenylacetate-CoA ligase